VQLLIVYTKSRLKIEGVNMRICYLSDANSVHTKKWCSFFKDLGYDIHVISLNNGDIPGVTVHSFNIESEKVEKESLLYKVEYFKFIAKVRKLVEKIKPDILHAHYATSYGFLGGLTGFHPYIISVWGSDVYEFPKKNIICKKFLEKNLSRADIILSTSKAMAEETKKYTYKDIQITPFGVDINIFKPFDSRYKEKEKVIIGAIKTFDIKYGIEYLIRAFGELCYKYHNIELQLAGRGPLEESLKKLCKELNIEDRVKFLGYIDQKKVVENFNKFDIAVIPSLFESFGVSAVEAQACGTPTIVTNTGGLPEATSPNNSSIVVETKNVSQLKNAIEKLILDKELRRTMGEYGRKFVVENYNVLDNFNNVNNIYTSALELR